MRCVLPPFCPVLSPKPQKQKTQQKTNKTKNPTKKGLLPNDVRPAMRAAQPGTPDTWDNLYAFFLGRARDNLHVLLCFSPVGGRFARRAQAFPGIISCTTIDWFLPWPEEALTSGVCVWFVFFGVATLCFFGGGGGLQALSRFFRPTQLKPTQNPHKKTNKKVSGRFIDAFEMAPGGPPGVKPALRQLMGEVHGAVTAACADYYERFR